MYCNNKKEGTILIEVFAVIMAIAAISMYLPQIVNSIIQILICIGLIYYAYVLPRLFIAKNSRKQAQKLNIFLTGTTAYAGAYGIAEIMLHNNYRYWLSAVAGLLAISRFIYMLNKQQNKPQDKQQDMQYSNKKNTSPLQAR